MYMRTVKVTPEARANAYRRNALAAQRRREEKRRQAVEDADTKTAESSDSGRSTGQET